MLDAFIIDRIRKEKEESRTIQVPLVIHVPQPPPPRDERPQSGSDERSPRQERGITEIDFSI